MYKYKSNTTGVIHIAKDHRIFENIMTCGQSDLEDATLAMLHTDEPVTCEECTKTLSLGEGYSTLSLKSQRDLQVRLDGMLKLCDPGEELELVKTLTTLCNMKYRSPKRENLVSLLTKLVSVTKHDYNRKLYNELLLEV